MVISKRILIFLGIAQALLSFLHFLIYELLQNFFPLAAQYKISSLIFLLILSFSFVFFSITTFNRDTFLLRWGYAISATGLVWGLYFLVLSSAALIIYMATGFYLSMLGGMAFAGSVLLTLYGLINARSPQFTEITVKLPNLPAFWRNKIAVMVSDLHFGQTLRADTAKKIVRLINEQRPDIVFIPGDFYDGPKTNLNATAKEFKNLEAPLGTYFSSGNHEVIAGYEQCEEAIAGAGIKVLEDEKTEIEGLQIIGLAYMEETDTNVKDRLKKINFDKNKPSILLKHVPNHLDPIAEAGINLQLSGHTHLGQVWPFKYLTAKMFKGYDYGFKKLRDLQIFTSSGIGTWGPPIRVFTKAELVKITFE